MARQTAVELISSGQAHLVLLRWPTDEVLSEHCDERQLDNDSVFDIENNNDDSYLALSPTTPWT
ncbi:hypothetical protein [Nocardia brasiliensis]|uniref:hypothetical protein n=1 Tax=Nocardia brasiliensis TaxID=37326 RepID=UPI0005A98472|nr:hypothetical protein [Nocardia brasiliensis]